MSFLCNQNSVKELLSEDLSAYLKHLAFPNGLLNSKSQIEKHGELSYVENHLNIISSLLFRKEEPQLNSAQTKVLLNTFFEYMLNTKCIFRNNAVFTLIKNLTQKWNE